MYQWGHTIYTSIDSVFVNQTQYHTMQRRKSPRKNQKQPHYYGIEGNQDRVEENTLTLGARGRSSSKKKHRLGYKRSRQQLRVPSRKNASSLSSSHLSSSEYEESSDDDEKEPTVDKRHKGSQKAINSVHRSRRNERDVDDDTIQALKTRKLTKKTMKTMMRVSKSKSQRRDGRTK